MTSILVAAGLGALLGALASGVLWLTCRAPAPPPGPRRLTDADALDALRLARYFLRRLGVTDPDDLDDGAQAAVVVLAERGVSGRCALSTQVRRVTQSWARSLRARARAERAALDELGAASAAEPSRDGPSREDVAELTARAALTSRQADAARLALDGLEIAEIAERLGISELAVRDRLRRARAKMRDLSHPR